MGKLDTHLIHANKVVEPADRGCAKMLYHPAIPVVKY